MEKKRRGRPRISGDADTRVAIQVSATTRQQLNRLLPAGMSQDAFLKLVLAAMDPTKDVSVNHVEAVIKALGAIDTT